MELNDYQDKAKATAIYPHEHRITYPSLGICGEAGEVAEKVKKVIRDKGGQFDYSACQSIMKELGDIMWYVANLSSELGYTLEDVAQANIDKLQSRADRGKLQGEGDDR